MPYLRRNRVNKPLIFAFDKPLSYLCTEKFLSTSHLRRAHLYIISVIILCAISAGAVSGPVGEKDIDFVQVSDTTALTDSVIVADTVVRDTTAKRRSRIRREKVDLDNVVKFSAKDSIVLEGQSKVYMYGSSEINYGDINLTADHLDMDISTSTVYAVGTPDTTGEVIGSPVFKDKSGEYNPKTINYNFKTERGYITDVVTQQGEGYLTGGMTKKMETGEFYLKDGRYTTCDNHEHPHFYLQSKGYTQEKYRHRSRLHGFGRIAVAFGCPVRVLPLFRKILFGNHLPHIRR